MHRARGSPTNWVVVHRHGKLFKIEKAMPVIGPFATRLRHNRSDGHSVTLGT